MVLLLHSGRCYDALSAAIDMFFCLVSFLAKVRFWPKTMDYNKEIEVIYVVLLLLTGRCYEPEICAILLLRCTLAWYRVKVFCFWQTL